MRKNTKLVDYEPVTRPAKSSYASAAVPEADWQVIRPIKVSRAAEVRREDFSGEPESLRSTTESSVTRVLSDAEQWSSKRGHALTFAGLFLFTFLVYFRPYELFPSLSWMSRSAFIVAILTLVAFVPTQLGLENKLTTRPREVNLVLLLWLASVLSIPLALEPPKAFWSFVEYSKVLAIFIVMVNVVRTEARLRSLIVLVLFASCVLSVAALVDYATGNLELEGKRILGLVGGLFSNPNDLALHLVTMIPICLVLLLGSRGIGSRLLYLVCGLVMMAGLVATFSRGGFIGFVCVLGFLAWKLTRRYKAILGIVALAAIVAVVAIAPSAYRSRLTTTDDGSAQARTNDLKRSILVAARHPIFGVGMDNYILYSNFNKTTHNAYTQVASEMGFLAFLVYLGFLIVPFKRLHRVGKALETQKRKPRTYYLAIGLQAGLLGYMVVSFFASVAYQWYVYYLVAYALCVHRLALSQQQQLTPSRP